MDVWIGRVVVNDGTDEQAIVASTQWASPHEAHAFVERALSHATVPAGFPDGAELRGLVVPAVTSVTFVDGEPVESADDDISRCVFARLDAAGNVIW